MNQRWAEDRFSRRSLLAGVAGIAVASWLAGCRGPNQPVSATSDARLKVVATESFWGSIAAQIGGRFIDVTSLISNPASDPHDFEPKPSDARMIADARYVILNGAGYDPWMQRLLDANPTKGRKILNVADLSGKKRGDNPHLWYDPKIVDAVALRIGQDLSSLDAAHANSYREQQRTFSDIGLKPYHDLIKEIASSAGGTSIGATESLFDYMAEALGLDLISPVGFMRAISEGNDVTAADKATFDQQITERQIAVLLYNTQNAAPATEVVRKKALAVGIPVVDITETLSPRDSTFQAWQVQQLTALQRALMAGAGG